MSISRHSQNPVGNVSKAEFDHEILKMKSERKAVTHGDIGILERRTDEVSDQQRAYMQVTLTTLDDDKQELLDTYSALATKTRSTAFENGNFVGSVENPYKRQEEALQKIYDKVESGDIEEYELSTLSELLEGTSLLIVETEDSESSEIEKCAKHDVLNAIKELQQSAAEKAREFDEQSTLDPPDTNDLASKLRNLPPKKLKQLCKKLGFDSLRKEIKKRQETEPEPGIMEDPGVAAIVEGVNNLYDDYLAVKEELGIVSSSWTDLLPPDLQNMKILCDGLTEFKDSSLEQWSNLQELIAVGKRAGHAFSRSSVAAVLEEKIGRKPTESEIDIAFAVTQHKYEAEFFRKTDQMTDIVDWASVVFTTASTIADVTFETAPLIASIFEPIAELGTDIVPALSILSRLNGCRRDLSKLLRNMSVMSKTKKTIGKLRKADIKKHADRVADATTKQFRAERNAQKKYVALMQFFGNNEASEQVKDPTFDVQTAAEQFDIKTEVQKKLAARDCQNKLQSLMRKVGDKEHIRKAGAPNFNFQSFTKDFDINGAIKNYNKKHANGNAKIANANAKKIMKEWKSIEAAASRIENPGDNKIYHDEYFEKRAELVWAELNEAITDLNNCTNESDLLLQDIDDLMKLPEPAPWIQMAKASTGEPGKVTMITKDDERLVEQQRRREALMSGQNIADFTKQVTQPPSSPKIAAASITEPGNVTKITKDDDRMIEHKERGESLLSLRRQGLERQMAVYHLMRYMERVAQDAVVENTVDLMTNTACTAGAVANTVTAFTGGMDLGIGISVGLLTTIGAHGASLGAKSVYTLYQGISRTLEDKKAFNNLPEDKQKDILQAKDALEMQETIIDRLVAINKKVEKSRGSLEGQMGTMKIMSDEESKQLQTLADPVAQEYAEEITALITNFNTLHVRLREIEDKMNMENSNMFVVPSTDEMINEIVKVAELELELEVLEDFTKYERKPDVADVPACVLLANILYPEELRPSRTANLAYKAVGAAKKLPFVGKAISKKVPDNLGKGANYKQVAEEFLSDPDALRERLEKFNLSKLRKTS